VDSQRPDISAHREKLKACAYEIQQLSTDKKGLLEKVSGLEKQLSEASDRMEELQEDCRGCKESSMAALKEQEDLSRRYQGSFQQAINEIHVQKAAIEARLSDAVEKSEAEQAHLNGIIKSMEEETNCQIENRKYLKITLQAYASLTRPQATRGSAT